MGSRLFTVCSPSWQAAAASAAAATALCLFPPCLEGHPASDNGYQNPGPHQHCTGTNVLVIFNTAWQDSDTNGVNDSLEVAQYYTLRRAVPTNNLLGVTVSNYLDTTWKDYIAYDVFYSNVLVPVVAKLDATNEMTGQPFSSTIYYLCPVFGVPPDVNTWFNNNENPLSPYVNNRRSLDAFLMNAYLMRDNGLYLTNGNNRPGVAGSMKALNPQFGDMWGDWWTEVGYDNINDPVCDWFNKYYDDADDPATSAHFKAKRDAEWPARMVTSYWYFLVTRVDAPTKDAAIGIVDMTLYAERYLRNWAGHPATGGYGRAYTDDDDQYFGDGYYAPSTFWNSLGGDIKNWFRGDSVGDAGHSVFDTSQTRWLAPWDWIQDSQPLEIGESGALPVLTNFHIAALNGFTASVWYAASTADFFYYVAGTLLRGSEGRTVRSTGGGSATLLAVGTNGGGLAWGDLVLSATNGFAAGQLLSVAPIESFQLPLRDVQWYSAYYRAGYYPDAFQWLPGSVAIHNESYACRTFRHGTEDNFAARALQRGLTAIPGAVEEPFEVGVPFARKFYRAFCQGFDYAEACYQSTACAIAWMDCFIGDPLYNPFMALYTDSNRCDTVPPSVAVTNHPGSLVIAARLGTNTADDADEIAQFRLYAGYDSNAWAYTNDFVSWPNPASATWDATRRYGWSRMARWTFATPTNWFYFQVAARDPAGNMTTMPVQAAVIPEPWLPPLLVALAAAVRRRTSWRPARPAAAGSCPVQPHASLDPA